MKSLRILSTSYPTYWPGCHISLMNTAHGSRTPKKNPCSATYDISLKSKPRMHSILLYWNQSGSQRSWPPNVVDRTPAPTMMASRQLHPLRAEARSWQVRSLRSRVLSVEETIISRLNAESSCPGPKKIVSQRSWKIVDVSIAPVRILQVNVKKIDSARAQHVKYE